MSSLTGRYGGYDLPGALQFGGTTSSRTTSSNPFYNPQTEIDNQRRRDEAYRRTEDQRYERERTEDQAEADKFRTDQASVAAKYAEDFLSQWNKSTAETKGVFNTAMASIDELQPYIDKMSAYGENINDLIQTAQTDLAAYREKYSPFETEAIETSRMALGEQRGYMEQLRGLSVADYKGVSGRAKADVAAESERGRRAEARTLQGFGLDPTSGRYRGSIRSSRISEALNKVLAANAARLDEKGRVAGIAQEGLRTISPAAMGGDIAAGIQTGGMDYNKLIESFSKTGAGIKKAATEAKTAGITAGTDLASAYGKAITEPYAEGFGTMLGAGIATDPTKMRNIGNITGIAPSPDNMQ